MTSRRIGIVLAGGASSRFGEDKLVAPLDGRPLLHHALEAIAAVADHVVLVLAPAAAIPPLPRSVVGRITVTRDREPHAGPLAGLVAGLDAAATLDRDGSGAVALVVGGDMPSLLPEVLRLLADALEAAPARHMAITLEAPEPAPLPMAIRVSALARAIDLLAAGRRSLRALLETVEAVALPADRWRAIDPAGLTLHDVDRPQDLAPPGDRPA